MDTQRTPIREYGLGGLIRDVRPWDVPVNSFTLLRNVRIEDAAIATFEDVATVLGPFVDDATGLVTIKPVYAAPFWISQGASVIILVLDNGEVRSYADTSTYTLQLPAAGVDVAADFYHTQAGESFHLTSKSNIPQTLFAADVGTPASMTNMPGWPATYRCGILESYKNTLVAADIIVSGIDKPNLVKWSDVFVEGDTSWDWDETSTTNLAGENPVQSDGQGITALQPLRDSLMVYFDRSTWRMDFTGGQFVMNFKKVFTDDGALGKYAFANVSGRAMVVGLRDIYLHDGVQKQSISDGKLTRAFYSTLQLDYPVRLARYPLRNETWITYRDKTTGEANRALIHNSLHNAFTPADLVSETTSDGDFIGVFLGPRLSVGIVTWDGLGGTWDDLGTTTWADLYSTAEDTIMYGLSNDTGALLDLDAKSTGSPRLRRNVLIEHERIDLEEWLQTSGDKVVYISRAYPQYSGNGQLEIRFGVANTTNDSVQWEAWQTFDMATDYAVDFRAAGRYLAYQVRPVGQTTPNFACSGFDLEWAVVGEQ